MTKFITKEIILRRNYLKKELLMLVLKSFRANLIIPLRQKYYFYERFFRLSKDSSISLLRNKCLFTGWSRSVFRHFKMSRHSVKIFANSGFLCGLRKTGF